MTTLFANRSLGKTASIIAFPGHLRARSGALDEAIKSHRLPDALESALLREISVSGDGMKELERIVARRLRPAPIDLAAARTIILFGPSGSGKSLVAARIVQAAKAMGRDARIVAAAKGLGNRASSRTALIVADCAGFNPRNAKARAAFAALSDLPHALTIGVLSALEDAQEVSDTVAAFAMRRVIITGLDMTRRAGALAAASLEGAWLAHVTRGAGLENLAPADLAGLLATKAAAH